MKIRKTYQGEVPENKIVNTKSTSQEDTYSCDYINNNIDRLHTYSEEEIKIGTWLGKPLYRKVIVQEVTSSTMNYNVPHNISNIDVIRVNSDSCCMSKSGDSMKTTPLTQPSNQITTTEEYSYRFNNVSANATDVVMHVGIYNHFGTATCYIILEYTKTTD